MKRLKVYSFLAVYALFAWMATPGWAENEGRDDLDQATEKKLTAQKLGDLEEVAGLCRSAIKKGLAEGDRKFAEQLLCSTLFERATRYCEPIFEAQRPSNQWRTLRRLALTDLEEAIQLDETLGEAHLLQCRLQSLPGGDPKTAKKAADKAVEHSGRDLQQKAKALVLRGRLSLEQPEKASRDFAEAVKLDPRNEEALRLLAASYLGNENYDEAEKAIRQLIQSNDTPAARMALGDVLMEQEKYKKALAEYDKAIQMEPGASALYVQRARTRWLLEDDKEALADLNKALELRPTQLNALLLRARLHLSEERVEQARADVDQMLKLQPGLPQGVMLRSIILAEEGKMSEAIADVQSLLKREPKNAAWRMQLANYYARDKRPSKAIQIFSEIVADEPENWLALQARADTMLNVGRQAEAVADYEKILKAQPEDDSILNNLAWVLATSPNEKLRDGKRAIELARKACELTEYKKPHIISTLAAGYAETGDFENAVKWSRKAVDMGVESEEVDQQLKQELESYQKKKPWREKQEVKEKPEPLQEGPGVGV